jgi:hypothetical protein
LRVVTGDETYVHWYNPEIKQQSSQRKSLPSPSLKKVRQVRSNNKSKLVTFLDCEGIVHQEFVPLVQTVNQHYYRDFCIVWGSKPAKNIRNNGRIRIGLFTMIMSRHTLLCQCSSFCCQKHGCGPPPSLLTWYGPMWLLLVSKNEITAKRVSFPGCVWNSVTITECPTPDSKMSVPTVLPAVVETLNPLHKLRRGLLWRWQQPITKVSIYFVINSDWEVFDMLLYTEN